MTGVDNTLLALADPTRRRVVDLLRERPRLAGELANASRMSAPAMSRHLRVLLKHGLIESERGQEDARRRVFRLNQKPFSDLQAWLSQVEAAWSEQLDSFKAHTERKRSDGREWERKEKRTPKRKKKRTGKPR